MDQKISSGVKARVRARLQISNGEPGRTQTYGVPDAEQAMWTPKINKFRLLGGNYKKCPDAPVENNKKGVAARHCNHPRPLRLVMRRTQLQHWSSAM